MYAYVEKNNNLLMLQGGTFGFIHDILVTDQHYIILENPIKMNFGRLLGKYAFAKACLAECLEYQDTKPTKIHVIARPGKQSSVLGMLFARHSELMFRLSHACTSNLFCQGLPNRMPRV